VAASLPVTTASLVAGRPARLRRLLLAWYHADARELPWRATRDPWAVMVSEVMLQQTQAARVVPAWRAFLERFPAPAALARVPVGAAVDAWAGLGYNRRAVNLHRAATAIVERHGGRVPAELGALRALPGIGEYTARALLAFAFARDAAPVDTNVARVLARAVACEPLSRRAVQELADRMVPRGQAHDWSSALMDLGARYCRARAPRCDACPVAAACSWRLAGRPAGDPAAAGDLRPRPQAGFAGSDRYHRGRLVAALRRGPIRPEDLPAAADLLGTGGDSGRLAALTGTLVADGLAEWSEGALRLPR
jgi:A/G-specific adenine glycosylase